MIMRDMNVEDCELASLRSDGYQARQAGKPKTTNPAYRADQLAAADTRPEAWRARSGAWNAGWTEADRELSGVRPRSTRKKAVSPLFAAKSAPLDVARPQMASAAGSGTAPTVGPEGGHAHGAEAPAMRWYIVDKSGQRRLSAFLMTAEEAARHFPGAVPAESTVQVRPDATA